MDKEVQISEFRSLKITVGTFLALQWLRLHTPNAGGTGSTPGGGIRSHMPRGKMKKKKKEREITIIICIIPSP